MASTTASSLHFSQAEVRTGTAAVSIPWYIWCATFAITSAIVGAHWDISWHTSIGRDSFWTPAHIAIYLCGVLAGIAFGYLILHTTFAKSSPLAAASVHIWGFRAPLGAFISSWGGVAMLTSAPFDNWWHDAYGLDVKIVSPPHVLLFMGVYAVAFGTLVLIAGHMNRSVGEARESARLLLMYVCGIMLTMTMVILLEYTNRPRLHGSQAYILMAALPPIIMTLGARAGGFRFGATFIAAFYMLFTIGLILVLPLFAAEPKLGPVYQHVTHFVPPQFPVLLIVPAFALDLLWLRTKGWPLWKTALVSGLLYVAVLLAVEWPFANFLMSAGARNRFFGAEYMSFSSPPTSFLARNLFVPFEGPSSFWSGMLLAALAGTLAVRWGISRGIFLAKIKR
jgi:hypothetical protein